MEIDAERVDEAVLALLLLGLHDGCRVWKGFDWDAMAPLSARGEYLGKKALGLALSLLGLASPYRR